VYFSFPANTVCRVQIFILSRYSTVHSQGSFYTADIASTCLITTSPCFQSLDSQGLLFTTGVTVQPNFIYSFSSNLDSQGILLTPYVVSYFISAVCSVLPFLIPRLLSSMVQSLAFYHNFFMVASSPLHGSVLRLSHPSEARFNCLE
jgi:hypothetical protein